MSSVGMAQPGYDPDDGVQVGPHAFAPRKAGGCRACYLDELLHPTRGWAPARPLDYEPGVLERVRNWFAKWGQPHE